ncbi:SAM-dependent methyltransferase [Nocardia thailandica]|uniref:SAM-dependent methyltransferase n=1 Tax=Nocardia thailandica TaxID=257275 RepID=UPI0005B846D5|nr:SAM-dependent methyltransferase [Nocardia thailandica]
MPTTAFPTCGCSQPHTGGRCDTGSRRTDLRYDVANSARVSNWLLGGKDYYDIDRLVAKHAADRVVAATCEARRFLLRAVEHLTNEHGVYQYVELGCGIPLPPNLGDVAGREVERARVLYLDHDQLVAAHARAVVVKGPDRRFSMVDITDTATVLDQITAFFDLDLPIALCLSGTAEFLADPRAVLAELAGGLPPNSWLILSHITEDIFGDEIRTWATHLTYHGIPYRPRDHTTVSAMLAPYQLLDSGIVAPHRWRPDTGDPTYQPSHHQQSDLSCYAAVGRYSV